MAEVCLKIELGNNNFACGLNEMSSKFFNIFLRDVDKILNLVGKFSSLPPRSRGSAEITLTAGLGSQSARLEALLRYWRYCLRLHVHNQ